jgi:hypothetical protein
MIDFLCVGRAKKGDRGERRKKKEGGGMPQMGKGKMRGGNKIKTVSHTHNLHLLFALEYGGQNAISRAFLATKQRRGRGKGREEEKKKEGEDSKAAATATQKVSCCEGATSKSEF